LITIKVFSPTDAQLYSGYYPILIIIKVFSPTDAQLDCGYYPILVIIKVFSPTDAQLDCGYYPIVHQLVKKLVKKFDTFYGTRRFPVFFTTTRSWVICCILLSEIF
jgi:hypothetical protein